MRRVPKWVSGVAIAIFLVGIPVGSPFLLSALIVHSKNVYAEKMHEGRIVADAIYASDHSVDVAVYTDEQGHADVVVRQVFEQQKQPTPSWRDSFFF